jgi:hypothetical protein
MTRMGKRDHENKVLGTATPLFEVPMHNMSELGDRPLPEAVESGLGAWITEGPSTETARR